MIKPTPHQEELGRVGAKTYHDFIDSQIKLGRYNAWLGRATRTLPPYADRSSRTTGEGAPIADDVSRLLWILEQARAREAAATKNAARRAADTSVISGGRLDRRQGIANKVIV